jgi:hypothetical protein
VSRVWPTYEVHAYYDTGETITDSQGKPQKLLEALAPFGYMLHHKGPFYGFSDLMAGADGANLTQIAPNLYKASVPKDGAIRIKTTLRAEEKPLRDCCSQKPPVVHVHVSPRGCYCRAPGGAGGDSRLLYLGLLPAAVFFMRRRSRAKN